FGRTRPVLGGLSDIAARLAADVPGFRAGNGVIANGGSVGLIEDAASGTVFLVKAIGDRVVTRKLSHATLGAVTSDGTALRLRLRDFTFPQATVALAAADASRAWEARLKRTA